jgi:hypothetical protein
MGQVLSFSRITPLILPYTEILQKVLQKPSNRISKVNSNAICLYCRIWLVTILRKISNLKVVTKGFSWKEPPSWKCEILHVTIHKNT